MSALPFLFPWKIMDANTAETMTDFLSPRGMKQQKSRESKIRSRQDEPFIITIGARWKCSNVCSWGILTDREIWTLSLHDLIIPSGIGHLVLRLFDNINLKAPPFIPCIYTECKGESEKGSTSGRYTRGVLSRIRESKSSAKIFILHASLHSWVDILVS